MKKDSAGPPSAPPLEQAYPAIQPVGVNPQPGAAVYPQPLPQHQQGPYSAVPAATTYAQQQQQQQFPLLYDYVESGQQHEYARRVMRHAFMFKVLGLVAVQLAITAAVSGTLLLSSSAQRFVYSNSWVVGLSIGVTFATLLLLACSEQTRRKHPTNLILLFAFTAAESVLVGTASIAYDTDIVVLAFVMTAGITICLTLYALQTKTDFTASGGILFCALIALLLASLLNIFLHTKTLNLIVSGVGALVFSAYIVYDIQLISEGQHKYELSTDEYVFAAINIYTDVINLFLYLLQFLQELQDN